MNQWQQYEHVLATLRLLTAADTTGDPMFDERELIAGTGLASFPLRLRLGELVEDGLVAKDVWVDRMHYRLRDNGDAA
ncbi:MAG TPA: hypothetical protein VGB79_01675 [Allosphingosinicella sp.]